MEADRRTVNAQSMVHMLVCSFGVVAANAAECHVKASNIMLGFKQFPDCQIISGGSTGNCGVMLAISWVSKGLCGDEGFRGEVICHLPGWPINRQLTHVGY